MKRFLAISKLGIKYLVRYRRRYLFLFIALVFGFASVTFVTSTKDGMYDNVYYAAQSHYAGDVVVVAYETLGRHFIHRMGQDEVSTILNSVALSEINPVHIVKRTLAGENMLVHYNGVAVPLRYLMGCDWDEEEHLLAMMNFAEAPMPKIGDDSIILSALIAQQLGVRMGDMVILEMDTRYGQRNTGLFIVRGIVEDSSIFGYFKAYISRLSHNRLLLFDDDDCSTIGLFLDNPATAEQDRARLHEVLQPLLQTGPIIHNREEMLRERERVWDGSRYFIYTLPVYLSEIAFMLDAMNIVSYLVYIMMLIIILVSAAVTYRLILHERAREMGVMRVMGFYGRDLRLVLWTEIILLGLVSMIAGFVLARIMSRASSFLSFSWFPGFEIFLNNGRLSAIYLPGTTLLNVALLLIVLVFLALVPSFRVSRKNLPGLLSGESI